MTKIATTTPADQQWMSTCEQARKLRDAQLLEEQERHAQAVSDIEAQFTQAVKEATIERDSAL